MKYEEINNTLYFDSDDDFYDWCVVPALKPVKYINKDNKESYYSDFDLTYEYYNALKEGKQFIIKDEDSQIYKHGAVYYRTITKPIKNLMPYFGERFHKDLVDRKNKNN